MSGLKLRDDLIFGDECEIYACNFDAGFWFALTAILLQMWLSLVYLWGRGRRKRRLLYRFRLLALLLHKGGPGGFKDYSAHRNSPTWRGFLF
jgi:hypothetical protein